MSSTCLEGKEFNSQTYYPKKRERERERKKETERKKESERKRVKERERHHFTEVKYMEAIRLGDAAGIFWLVVKYFAAFNPS